jgi:SulP family sulfate permease
MIAQTLVNLSAGSRARLSGIVAALAILVIILFGAPVELCQRGFSWSDDMVAIGTFEWISFRIKKMPKHDIFVESWWLLLFYYIIWHWPF